MCRLPLAYVQQATISLRADELGLQWINRLVNSLSCGSLCARLLNLWNAHKIQYNTECTDLSRVI